MFEIKFAANEYVFCEDMLDGGYYIFYKDGGKRKENALYMSYDYKAAIAAWERFKSGKIKEV